MDAKSLTMERNQLLSKKLLANLEKRNYECYYVDTIAEGVEKAVSLIPEGSSVSWGGTLSIRESGLAQRMNEGNYVALDRDKAKSTEELHEIQKKALTCDCYLTSVNAVTEDGIIVNVDGSSNRIAAMGYGPKNVIMLVGMNKIVKTVDGALERVRNTVAPINMMRIKANNPAINTPCVTTGACHNCLSEGCICNNILITRRCSVKGRIKIILVGEQLGL